MLGSQKTRLLMAALAILPPAAESHGFASIWHFLSFHFYQCGGCVGFSQCAFSFSLADD